MPGARDMRLARRLAGGMTPAEVAAIEGADESEILERLDDEGFARLVEDYRDEQSLPEDEREALLIEAALAGLQRLADRGDVKVQRFLAYEDARGRHVESRLRRLPPCFLSPAEAVGESREVAGTLVSRPCMVFPDRPRR